jgi:hypothetical protein
VGGCPSGIFQYFLDDSIIYRVIFFELGKKHGPASTDDFVDFGDIEIRLFHKGYF